MLRRVVAWLTVTVVLLVALGLVVYGPGGGTASGGELSVGQQSEFDSTVFRIEVLENGDARWTVEQSRVLENDDEAAQFRAFAATFRNESTEAFDNFQIRAETLTESGTESTGRQMNSTAFERDAFIDQLGQRRGVVEMSFVWTNFSQQQNSSLVVADVFGGGWGIVEDQRLTIQAGDALVFEEVSPSPDSMSVAGNLSGSDSVTWFGERQFADKRPRIVLVSEQQASTGTGTPTPDNETSTTGDTTDTTPADDGGDGNGTAPSNTDSDMGMSLLLLVLVLLVSVGGGFAWYSGALSRSSEGRVAGTDDAVTTTGSTQTDTASPSPVPEEELLSDEDRVLRLLEDHGGRMKQVNIVEQTDWSKSKVSMLLSEMEEEGQISKLRVGRENIISISGEEPEAVGSPFDDE